MAGNRSAAGSEWEPRLAEIEQALKSFDTEFESRLVRTVADVDVKIARATTDNLKWTMGLLAALTLNGVFAWYQTKSVESLEVKLDIAMADTNALSGKVDQLIQYTAGVSDLKRNDDTLTQQLTDIGKELAVHQSRIEDLRTAGR